MGVSTDMNQQGTFVNSCRRDYITVGCTLLGQRVSYVEQKVLHHRCLSQIHPPEGSKSKAMLSNSTLSCARSVLGYSRVSKNVGERHLTD